MPPRRVQQKASPQPHPGEELNSPFRYQANIRVEEAAPSPIVSHTPAEAPDMRAIQYLIGTVERMQSRLFFMEKFVQEHIQERDTAPIAPTTEATPPEPPVVEAPITITARVDAPAATGTGMMLLNLDTPCEKREEVIATEAAETEDLKPVFDSHPAAFPYAGNPSYSTAFAKRISQKWPRQMGRNDITRVFEMQIKRGYTPADLLLLEERWATFCKYPAPHHLWATLLDPDLVKDLCSYFQLSREKFENSSNSMVALLLQLFVAPRDVSYFIGYLKALKAETKASSAPSFDITLPMATFTTEFISLYCLLAESVRSPQIQPVVVGGGDNPDTVYKIYLKGLGPYGTYIKTLIDQNKLPKLFSQRASVESFVSWTDMVVNAIQLNNNKLEELSVYIDAREAVLKVSQTRSDLLAVADSGPELEDTFGLEDGLEDIAVLCPVSGETKPVYPCTTTCLGNVCKRPYCRQSHAHPDLIAGVNSLKSKIDAVIAGGYKFLAPVGPSPTPSHPSSLTRSPARNPAR